MYRVGFPLWKTAARMGVPVLVRVHVHQDKDSGTFWADSPDLDGLAVSGKTLDELHKEVTSAADMLLEMAIDGHKTKAQTEIRIRDTAICAV